ncbi:MAG TPA: alpha/beta hydrolase [Terracidiphilus sp.]|nr:alpha/beta hydrolase [Terracidiphilus sp.]
MFPKVTKSIFAFLIVYLWVSVLIAQSQTPTPLWPGGAPGARGTTDSDNPKITIYLPKERNTGTGVLIFPGGSYAFLAMDHEGRQIAEWLNNLGVAAFVVQYRVAPYHHPVEINDAKRAMRYVRWHATEYKIAPERIGVWGFSAGGHLASTLGTHYDYGDPSSPDPIESVSSRPDFMVLAYPVIDPLASAAKDSFDNLLGKGADPALVRELSNDLHVNAQTPPTFLMAAGDDQAVSPECALNFYSALLKAGVPAELHIYESGGHGFGLGSTNPRVSSWSQRLAEWLRDRGLL